MVEYHVSTEMFAIYAGAVNPKRKDGSQTWKSKSDVTDEALCAVRDYLSLLATMKKTNSYGFEWYTESGKVVELVVKIRDKKKEENI